MGDTNYEMIPRECGLTTTSACYIPFRYVITHSANLNVCIIIFNPIAPKSAVVGGPVSLQVDRSQPAGG